MRGMSIGSLGRVGTALALGLVLTLAGCDRQASDEGGDAATAAPEAAPAGADAAAGEVRVSGAAEGRFAVTGASLVAVADEASIHVAGTERQFVSFTLRRDLLKAGELEVAGLGSDAAFTSAAVMASYSDAEGGAYLAKTGTLSLSEAGGVFAGTFRFEAQQPGKTETVTVNGRFSGAKAPGG